MKQFPLWFRNSFEEAIETFEDDKRIYAIRHIEEKDLWCLDGVDKDGLGGMAWPFMSRAQFEMSIERHGIKRPVQQMTLGI